MVQIARQAFFWFPREEASKWRIDVNSVDVTDDLLDSHFSHALAPEIGDFKITLDNNDNRYSGLYRGGETVELYLDILAGNTTRRFKGRIEKLKTVSSDSSGTILEIEGYHQSAELLDITVTEQISSTAASTVLTNLVTEYLGGLGYTTSNVSSSSTLITTNWDNKPFWEAVFELCEASGFDCYVDEDKDFHFFARESVTNEEEAIVWVDNMLSVDGLGEEIYDIKNKVTVYGEDDEGLPVVHTSKDQNSINTYGTRERVIKDTNVKNSSQAQTVGDFNRKDTAPTKGMATSYFLPSLRPGDMIWVTNPPAKIHNRYRIVRFTHKIPTGITESTITQNKEIPTFLRDRVKQGQSQEKVSNPHKMEYSYNFPFDDESNMSFKDTNVSIANGELFLASGTTGSFISSTKVGLADITQVQIQVVAEGLGSGSSAPVFQVSLDGGTNFDTVSIDTLTTIQNSVGKNLVLKITLNSTTTRLKSAALLYK